MTVTRRGFLGIGAAILGGALLPGKESTLDPECGALVDELAQNGLRQEKPRFEELGKIFAEEIQATMQRPGLCDRLFKEHYVPIEKEQLVLSGKVASLGDLNLSSSDETFRFWTGTEWREV